MSTIEDFVNKKGKWATSKSFNGKVKYTYLFRIWGSICSRCTAKSHLARRPTYVGCINKFKDFQEFACWTVVQVGYNNTGWHFDKDLLSRSSKEYSKETCLFLPAEINNFLIRQTKIRELPTGVKLSPNKKKFVAKYGHNDGHLGTFEKVEEAARAYAAAKEAAARNLAEKWKNEIDVRAYNTLLNYKVTEETW